MPHISYILMQYHCTRITPALPVFICLALLQRPIISLSIVAFPSIGSHRETSFRLPRARACCGAPPRLHALSCETLAHADRPDYSKTTTPPDYEDPEDTTDAEDHCRS